MRRKNTRTSIDVSDARAVKRWARELETDPETLIDAVAAVGSRVSRVREYLVYRHFEHLHANPKARPRPSH